MSDDDFFDGGEDDFDFDYESGSEEEPDVNLANQYYLSKELRNKPEEALSVCISTCAYSPIHDMYVQNICVNVKLLFKP